MAFVKQLNQAFTTVNYKNNTDIVIPAGLATLISKNDSFGVAITVSAIPAQTMGTIALDGFWQFPANESKALEQGETAFFNGEEVGVFGFPIGMIGEATEAGSGIANVFVSNTCSGAAVTVETEGATVGQIYIMGNVPFIYEVSTAFGALAFRDCCALPVAISGITAEAGTECCTESGGGAIIAKASGKTIVGYYAKSVASSDTVAYIYLAEKTATVPN